MITVTLNVDGDSLTPTLKDVLGSMTVEDKRKLAADMAYQYFVKEMNTGYKTSYGYNYDNDRRKADDYLRDLAGEVKNHISKQLCEDEVLKVKVASVLDCIKPDLPKFIERAVVSILAEQLATAFQNMTVLQNEVYSAKDALQKLGMAKQ